MSDDGWPSDRTVAAEQESGTPFDLSACVREPIHRLGGVQSYGALLAVRAGAVVVASDNAEALLGGPMDGPVTALLGEAELARLEALADADTGQTAMMPLELPGGRRFDVTVHRADGTLVLEFEPVRTAPGESARSTRRSGRRWCGCSGRSRSPRPVRRRYGRSARSPASTGSWRTASSRWTAPAR